MTEEKKPEGQEIALLLNEIIAKVNVAMSALVKEGILVEFQHEGALRVSYKGDVERVKEELTANATKDAKPEPKPEPKPKPKPKPKKAKRKSAEKS